MVRGVGVFEALLTSVATAMLEMIYETSFHPYVSNERELSMRINHRLINSSRKRKGRGTIRHERILRNNCYSIRRNYGNTLLTSSFRRIPPSEGRGIRSKASKIPLRIIAVIN